MNKEVSSKSEGFWEIAINSSRSVCRVGDEPLVVDLVEGAIVKETPRGGLQI